jgi:deoxyribodipyrimidine photo-lyase
MKSRVDQRRVRRIRDGRIGNGPVLYWMSRDQRVEDNWALLHAQDVALAHGVPLVVVFCLVREFLGAGRRQFAFMLDGLKAVSRGLEKKGIGFVLLEGAACDVLPPFVVQWDVASLITDFDPLRIKRAWLERVAASVACPVDQVDAHNIIPAWLVSPKREYGAYTLRPKVQRLLSEFLTPFPTLLPERAARRVAVGSPEWGAVPGDRAVPEVPGVVGGSAAAHGVLERFMAERLEDYAAASRDPTVPGVSELSPYIHFGQISAQRMASEVQGARVSADGEAAFLEQLIVRRELSDNFCYYTPNYDSLAAAPEWALETLDNHRDDPREQLYDLPCFEAADTHDPLWNAAQHELLHTGRIHGYLRMYWAKKVLEWSPSPEAALEWVVYLNDRYALDGRDPNGYVGAIWSIAGVHDRPWRERPVFGKIRYMNAAGCRRKFNVDAYIARSRHLADNRL